MSSASRFGIVGAALAASGVLACLAADAIDAGRLPQWRQHDVKRPRPPVVEPADELISTKPPRDAVVLFDGSNLDAWQARGGGPARWKVVDGTLEIAPGTGVIETRRNFGDLQLHAEWAAPSPAAGKGQDRGNSGIFLMGEFELQVLDSYQADTYADGQAGAIYGQFPPLFNAARPPGAWQSFDVAFRRPRFDPAGKLLAPARITLFHNGILVQDNEEPFGPTSWLKWFPYMDQGGKGPIALQDHGHPVRFRNIWVREIPERAAPGAEIPKPPASVKLAPGLLDRYAGRYRAGPDDLIVATIARDGARLTFTYPFRKEPLVLVPISETEFDMPFTDGRFTFHVDAAGKVVGVHIRVGDGDRELKRVEP